MKEANRMVGENNVGTDFKTGRSGKINQKYKYRKNYFLVKTLLVSTSDSF